MIVVVILVLIVTVVVEMVVQRMIQELADESENQRLKTNKSKTKVMIENDMSHTDRER